jgi:sensor histidine kinase YesM
MLSEKDEFILFSVYDTGCGISEEKLQAINEIIRHQDEEEYNVQDEFQLYNT